MFCVTKDMWRTSYLWETESKLCYIISSFFWCDWVQDVSHFHNQINTKHRDENHISAFQPQSALITQSPNSITQKHMLLQSLWFKKTKTSIKICTDKWPLFTVGYVSQGLADYKVTQAARKYDNHIHALMLVQYLLGLSYGRRKCSLQRQRFLYSFYFIQRPTCMSILKMCIHIFCSGIKLHTYKCTLLRK